MAAATRTLVAALLFFACLSPSAGYVTVSLPVACRRSGAAVVMSERGGGEGPRGMTRRDVGKVIGAGAVGSSLGGGGGEASAADKKKRKPEVATDKNMVDGPPMRLTVEVKAKNWLQKHPGGTRDLVVGLGGEPYFLIAARDGGSIEPYALRAECTHLGCIAPWRPEVGKHVCPCHGSEYDREGRVLRGPAPRSLELSKVEVLPDGKIRLSEWEGEDFREQKG